jgi:hypothetical protein
MERSLRIAALVALAASVAIGRARADFDRHCEERPLDAAERAAAARLQSAFRAALPDAPAGWTVREDGERASAVACELAGKTWAPGGKLVPQPVSISVHRRYDRPAPPASAAADAGPAPVKAAAAASGDPARRKELEARLDDLQRSRKDAAREYQEARRAGDRAALDAARRRDRELADAIRPVQEELSKLRRAQAGARAAESEARTAAAVAQRRAAEERRTDASVSITANLAAFQVRGAEALDAAGADVALRTTEGLALLLGPWRFGRGDGAAIATLDASAPRARVQTIAVEIAGNAATAEALRDEVRLAALRPLVGR